MGVTIARLLLESAGGRPKKPQSAGVEEIVYDAAAGGFVTRPRPQRITQWNEKLGALETIDAVWDEASQCFLPVQPTCTQAEQSGRTTTSSDWSPVEEARRFAQGNPKNPPD